MSELFGQAKDVAVLVGTDNITTAPGDLPLAEITARIAAQRDQFRHDNTIVPFAPCPGQPVEIWATSGEDLSLDHAILFYTTDGRLPDATATALPMERVRLDWDVQAGYLTRWHALLPAQPAHTIVRYRIGGWSTVAARSAQEMPDVWAQDGQGFWFHFSGTQAVTTFAFAVEDPAPLVPAWVQNAVIYQIFLDRFRTSESDGAFPANSDPQAFHGGTLRGVCSALPYLADLGVTCLWLSPINPAESYHRYDATDYYNVDPRLGTNEDLKELTNQAHALGMRVLLDFVPCHISWHHPAFVAAQRDQHAPSFDWFTFEQWPDRYRCFLETVPSLVSLRTESEGARNHIIGSAVQWMRDYGVDGFRLDHAIGHGMDFWTAFRRATRAVSPDVFSVGEVTDTPDSLVRYRGKLDGVLDFPLASALRHTFGVGNWHVRKFDSFLYAYEQYMASGPGRVSFLDNHDMNRFLFVADNDIERLKMAALCQFTLGAIPVIYYGTEVGMSQEMFDGDVEARRDMPWKQDSWNLDLLSFYQALTRMRHARPVLCQGRRHTVHLNEKQQTYAYLRTQGEGAEPGSGDVLVLFNLSDTSQTIPLLATMLPERSHCLLATSEDPVISRTRHKVETMLPPNSGVALLIE